MSLVIVVEHPLVQHKLTVMRSRDTDCQTFRRLMAEVAMLLAYELTRELPTKSTTIQTPLESMDAPVLACDAPVLVSVLRAGNGLLDGMLRLLPQASVGHIGLQRDPVTLEPVQYYLKVPPDLQDRPVLVVDPMLATGHSAAAAVRLLQERGARSIRFLCLLAAPEGLVRFHSEHPDVPVVTAAIDRELDAHGYIVPGLGDAGDRMYGTP